MGIPKNGGDSVQCHTDLTTCCTGGGQGIHRGDWYFPNGDRLQFGLRRWSAISPSGMYHWDIATVKPNQLTRKRVYVGLYAYGRGL